jgi:uncharacterized coiled-coil DUF342 family protein
MNTALDLLNSEITRISNKLDDYKREMDSARKEFEHYAKIVDELEYKMYELQQARDIIAAS